MPVKNIDYTKCNSCMRCFHICPMDVFAAVSRQVYIAWQEDCMCCYLCEIECPKDAIYVDPQRSQAKPFPW